MICVMTDIEDIRTFWLAQSDEDFEVAKTLIASKKYPHALFFCHLAVEKLLKSLVTRATRANAPYGHNLQRLAEDAGLILPDDIRESLAEINTFNIKARYDDFKTQFYKKATVDYAQRYLREAERILLWLKTQ